MRRDRCRDCGGSSICQHNRQRNYCKDCGGSAICKHGRQVHLGGFVGGYGIVTEIIFVPRSNSLVLSPFQMIIAEQVPRGMWRAIDLQAWQTTAILQGKYLPTCSLVAHKCILLASTPAFTQQPTNLMLLIGGRKNKTRDRLPTAYLTSCFFELH